MPTSILRRQGIRQNPVGMRDDPDVIRSEYADARRLEVRMAIYSRAADAALDAVAEVNPARVLDIGAGTGEFALRVAATGAMVTTVDSEPVMVARAHAAGLEAVMADACCLPFFDGAFACVVANWMLYHVLDRDRALAEMARVLRHDGRFVAATFSERNLEELWDALGDDTPRAHGFTAENGAAQLRQQFAHVEERHVEWQIEFADRTQLQAIVGATTRRSHLAPGVLRLGMPFKATARHAVFVASRQRRTAETSTTAS
jgi:ubiquinone/menaquinone biosynthesis C-methylase UbiE